MPYSHNSSVSRGGLAPAASLRTIENYFMATIFLGNYKNYSFSNRSVSRSAFVQGK